MGDTCGMRSGPCQRQESRGARRAPSGSACGGRADRDGQTARTLRPTGQILHPERNSSAQDGRCDQL